MIAAAFVTVALQISCFSFASGQKRNGVKSPTFHVWMIVQKHSGAPVGYLKNKDFRVSQGSHRYPVIVQQPVTHRSQSAIVSLPTHLLVLFDPKLSTCPDCLESAIDVLRPVWKRGWNVSFGLPSGFQTEYLSSEDQALRVFKAALAQAVAMPATPIDAVKTLEGFPGRRVLLYVSTTNGWQNTKMSEALAKEANRVMAQVYIVDGGEPAQSYSYPGEVRIQARSSQPASPSVLMESDGGFASLPPRDIFRFGCFHETSLRDAVYNSIKDAEGFYDLVVDCASNVCPDFKQPLWIHINRDGPVRVTAMGLGGAENLTFDISAR